MRGDVLNLMARPLHYERFYGEVEKLIRKLAPNRQIRLNINKWGLDLPEPQQHLMLAALYGARLMNVFERKGDLVTMSAVSDLINGWPGGIIQASRHGVFVAPVYLVNQLYATRLGADRLAAKISSPAFNSSCEGVGIPVLDVVTSRSADGSRIFIKAVNTSQQALQTLITLNGCEVEPKGEIETINADSLTDFNSFATPAAVSIKRAAVNAARSFSVDLPQHSGSVITLNLSRERRQ